MIKIIIIGVLIDYPTWSTPEYGFVPFPDSPEWNDFINNYKFAKTGPTTLYNEKNRGIQVQYGKSIGNIIII